MIKLLIKHIMFNNKEFLDDGKWKQLPNEMQAVSRMKI